MTFSKIYLQTGRDEAVRRFHPWVFSRAISRYEGDLNDGDVVEVFDNKSKYLATGHYHDGSIAVRLFSFNATAGGPVTPDVTYWTHKLKQIYTLRKAIIATNPATDATNCYRLVHGEGDGCTGLIIDMYNGVAVLQAHSIGMHRERELITEALKNVFGDQLTAVYDKSAETLPDEYGNTVTNGYLFGRTPVPHAAQENGHTFMIDWITGQKTGFFLDQRDNRDLLAKYAHDKRVLNAFCYSGGFSVYALQAGASLVHSVDSSQKAIDLTNRNVAANFSDEILAGRHEAYTDDVMAFLKKHDHQYDVVVLDPPAYAKSLSARHRAVQGYKRLNAEGLRRVASGGILFTFSCSQVVDRELFYNTIVAAAIEAGRQVRVLHHLSQPADHPVSLFHPEGGYLKGLVLWVE
ncbi:class I SAM-dependent rRNA methyltransferase [Spirosoma utsteinense]|uniref:23S rRNA (Cytosine1962-C5)-methyltransferase n=1 Tax=Spirosoma utsteinense TaxID=2585773 RepID=A0ABR6W1S1_9BACT|nr:class I SAM-dependent rRNA methyltransferase [Spirosoma utsteinense]MBC3785236.1 23S rRNA (cytosine1962-C5)-methyltransferase [Spirosoma utsteinense]MBC3790538.1 23S rRNA (cytosine1962-C5)-methyltransferase [Spirosoma utsteinense]